MAKSLHPVKTRRMVKTLRLSKSLHLAKSLRLSKSLCLVKYQHLWKCWRSRKVGSPLKNSLLFRLRRILNCWLLPGPADELVLLLVDVLNLEHVVSKWGMVPQCPAFMGELSPVLYRLLVQAHHAQKWSKSMRQPKIRHPHEIPLISVKSQQSLTLITGVLSLNRKNGNNHCCCPISAFILTTSELEAILEICCCSLKLSKRGKSKGGGEDSPWHLYTCLGRRCSR